MTSPCRRAGTGSPGGVYRASRLRAREEIIFLRGRKTQQREGRRRRLFSTFRLTRFGSGQQTELGPCTSSSQAHDESEQNASSLSTTMRVRTYMRVGRVPCWAPGSTTSLSCSDYARLRSDTPETKTAISHVSIEP